MQEQWPPTQLGVAKRETRCCRGQKPAVPRAELQEWTAGLVLERLGLKVTGQTRLLPGAQPKWTGQKGLVRDVESPRVVGVEAPQGTMWPLTTPSCHHPMDGESAPPQQ